MKTKGWRKRGDWRWTKTNVKQTCGEARLGGRLGCRDADGEGGGGGGRRLRPGEGPVAREGDGQAGRLHGGLVVPQLVDTLLLQQQGLLHPHQREGAACQWRRSAAHSPPGSGHNKTLQVDIHRFYTLCCLMTELNSVEADVSS